MVSFKKSPFAYREIDIHTLAIAIHYGYIE